MLNACFSKEGSGWPRKSVGSGSIRYYLWSQHQEQTRIRVIEQDPIPQVIPRIGPDGTLAPGPATALDRRVKDELTRINGELGGSPTGDRLNALAEQAKSLRTLPPTAHTRELNETIARIDSAREEALFNAIKVEQRTGNSKPLLELISEYKREFPSGNHSKEIERIHQDTVARIRDEARARVRAIPITSRESLTSKANEIRNYLKSYADDSHAAAMRRAANLAENLAASDSLRLRIKGCGFADAKKSETIRQRFW